MRLFVYGSLLSDFAPNKEITRILHNQSIVEGVYWIRGKLYDLGSYPGFRYDSSSRSRVRGELLLLINDPESTLNQLDRYEGIEYDRKEILLRTENHSPRVPIFLYEYNLAITHFPLIDEEDYRVFVKNNPTHRSFIGLV